MQNNVTEQLVEFFDFVVIGIIIALIFDFFRAYRKYKKSTNISVVIQDILFFLIVTVLIMFSMVYILNSSIRLYIFLAILVGIMLYIACFSKYFLKIYDIIINFFVESIKFIFLPINVVLQCLYVLAKFFRKIIKKCCKMFFYMIFLIRKMFNFKKVKTNKKCK